MRVIDKPNSRISFAGVPEIAHWLGLCSEDINRLTTVFPCEQYVHKLSTMSIKQYKALKEEIIPTDTEYCGQSKLCIPCMDTVTVLGRSWHLKAAQQTITTMISNFLKDPSTFHEASKHYQTQQPHYCSRNCSMVTKLCEWEQQQKLQHKPAGIATTGYQ